MRTLGFILLFMSIGAVLWRPDSRAAIRWLCVALVVLWMLILTACGGPRTPTESFAAASCTFRDTGEWRTRRERGNCISRTPKQSVNGHESGGNCIAWSQNTIREKMQAVTCSKERWVRR